MFTDVTATEKDISLEDDSTVHLRRGKEPLLILLLVMSCLKKSVGMVGQQNFTKTIYIFVLSLENAVYNMQNLTDC